MTALSKFDRLAEFTSEYHESSDFDVKFKKAFHKATGVIKDVADEKLNNTDDKL